MDKEIIKEYVAQDITIIWKPNTCSHAGECVKRLPNVYKPKDKPWIQPENANTDELIEQINACPSGALSFVRNSSSIGDESESGTAVKIIPNGPMMITGKISIEQSDGSTKEMEKAAFCRCGASNNKPFCDGTHNKVDFKG